MIDLLKAAVFGTAAGYLIYHAAMLALAAIEAAAPALLAAAR